MATATTSQKTFKTLYRFPKKRGGEVTTEQQTRKVQAEAEKDNPTEQDWQDAVTNVLATTHRCRSDEIQILSMEEFVKPDPPGAKLAGGPNAQEVQSLKRENKELRKEIQNCINEISEVYLILNEDGKKIDKLFNIVMELKNGTPDPSTDNSKEPQKTESKTGGKKTK